MGKGSGIAWCHHTFNPWWGCVEVSPACDNCYARTWDARFSGTSKAGVDMGDPHWGKEAPRKFFGDKHWNEPLKWNRGAEAKGVQELVFCASMSDVGETGREDIKPHRARLWDLVRKTRNLTWLFLSKRPQNFRPLLPDDLVGAPNVWLGTTIESPAYLWRAEALNENDKAAVRFLSMEPLIEHTSIEEHLSIKDEHVGIDWVITGCESGDNARHTPTGWYRSLQQESARYQIPFFLKQAPYGGDGISVGEGSWVKMKDNIVEQPYLDGVQYVQFPRAA